MFNLPIALYAGLFEPLKFNPPDLNGLGGFIIGEKTETKWSKRM